MTNHIPEPTPEKKFYQKDLVSELIPELFEIFRKQKIDISREQTERIARKIEEIQNYQPRVAVFGKTGAGKSSLCNSIFGKDVAAVSDTEACTRAPQEYLLKLSGDKAIVLIDVPGVGESEARDQEYAKLYSSLLPHVDLLLWVVKSDDRALAIDEHVWKTSVRAYLASGCPVFIVVNQVDKLNPVREWDCKNNLPGPTQQKLIAEKSAVLRTAFNLDADRIVPVSALERYNISGLVEAVVFALPNEKKPSFLNAVVEDVVSNTAKKEAKRGFWAAIGDFMNYIFEGIKPHIPDIVEIIMSVWIKQKHKTPRCQ